MKSRIEHVAVEAPVCSKHDNNALVFCCRFLQSLFDFGMRIGAFGINFRFLWRRLTKTGSAPCCYNKRDTQYQNLPIAVHLDLPPSRMERRRLSIRRKQFSPDRSPDGALRSVFQFALRECTSFRLSLCRMRWI